jgi:hypothetical protein
MAWAMSSSDNDYIAMDAAVASDAIPVAGSANHNWM